MEPLEPVGIVPKLGSLMATPPTKIGELEGPDPPLPLPFPPLPLPFPPLPLPFPPLPLPDVEPVLPVGQVTPGT
jgi:hypothetical protein